MDDFVTKAAFSFFIAFGVVLGGALFAGLGSVFLAYPPKIKMLQVANSLKIWALVAALGGTIDPIRVIESHVLVGYLSPAAQQVGYILFAFLGAHLGVELVQWMYGHRG